MPTLPETIEQAKATYLQAKAQLCSTFGNIPEERLNWSPSQTARTPIQIVAHCATAVKSINAQMEGTPFHYKTTAEAETAFRKDELQFHSREQVLNYLEEVSNNYLAWLDALTPERLASIAQLPFGLGAMPVENWLPFPAHHTRHHAAQLEYIQTIYGDQDWHLG